VSDKTTTRLLPDASGQQELFEQSLAEARAAKKAEPVECLGMTFENDDARRAYFTEKLKEKLADPEFRKIEGFPKGSDEDILRMSDPPYYTACPNPFLAEFIRCYGRPYDPNDGYHREPLAVDVSQGKTDPLYAAHSYHTKVPYKAIIPAILHYTEPGDVILDGFSGSGMTGVAAQMCGEPESELKLELEKAWDDADRSEPHWGARCVILGDLSPAATFIAANYNLPFDVKAFECEARRILKELASELGWMYETRHTDGKTKGRINYTVWSEVFACPECGGEVTFLDEALDPATKRVRDEFPCPHCAVTLTKDNLKRLFETLIDPATGKPWQRVRFVPVFINYSVGKGRFEKPLDNLDRVTLAKIAALPLPAAVPTDEFPIKTMSHGTRLAPKGFSRINHLYLPRAAQALGVLWAKVTALKDNRLRQMLLFFVEQAGWGLSLLNRYQPIQQGRPGGSQVNRQLSGVYYIASQISECSPWYNLDNKLARLAKVFAGAAASSGTTAITTGSAAVMALPANSVDYIFTDPPFGENIYYADLNFLVESWHRVWTDAAPEAIVDRAKGKEIRDYQQLMQRCFAEYYRALKPGRWMTMVFHNSHNAVWNAIQEALSAAGFVVADVRTLDKQQGSYRQVTSSAMKQDLVVSAYKPNGGLEQRFATEAGTEEGVWDFVRTHLRQLPVFATDEEGRAEVIAERTGRLLYDRMVAFHVQRGVLVPLSAAEFAAGMQNRFPPREDMFFLNDQVAEYDRRRMTTKELKQLDLFVTDESSAIEWIRAQLSRKAQTLQDLTPQFLREIGASWSKHEERPELRDILEHGFLCYDGTGPIPAQLVSWMRQSSTLRGLIDKAIAKGRARDDNGALVTEDAVLKGSVGDHWYVPDPSQAQDLEKLRERSLLREFADYRDSTARRLKVFRLEAVRAGFKRAWSDRDYATIIAVAEKIPDDVLQEDPNLLMWYDQAVTRAGAKS
jgi:16S rRNA G966 N2-methylase RsmD